MDFNKFLGSLDESKKMVTVSGEKFLGEAAGDGKWYYVPKEEYGGFRHIVVEKGDNDWEVHYLEKVGGAGGKKRDVSGIKGASFDAAKASTQKEAKDIERLINYLSEAKGDDAESLKQGQGEDNGVDLSGYVVQRSVTGDFAKILKECVDIVQGK